jgi:hypothetical protein
VILGHAEPRDQVFAVAFTGLVEAGADQQQTRRRVRAMERPPRGQQDVRRFRRS